MVTCIVEIGDLLSPLGAEGVKKQLLRVPGVRHVDVNYAAASATVCYDQTATSLAISTHPLEKVKVLVTD